MSTDELLLGKAGLIAVDAIKPNPWNYNQQKDSIFAKLVASIRRYGFARPLIVRTLDDGTKEVIDGEHGLNAAKLLKMPEVPCIDLGTVPDSRAKEMTIILNELGGRPDEARLGDLLKSIAATVDVEEAMAVMPYTAQQLEMLTSAVDFSFTSSPKVDSRAQLPAPEGKPQPPKKPKAQKTSKLKVEFTGDHASEVAGLLASIDQPAETVVLEALRDMMGAS